MRFIGISVFVAIVLLIKHPANGQYIENFDSMDSPAVRGWAVMSGDGAATISIHQNQGFISVQVDATKDKRNLWWALLKRQINEIDVDALAKPGYEIRSEARIRVSHAPRRVNLHFNHQRTTDFHSHLMEYDIPDTTNWHVISLTTKHFDALPGDRINAQMALMDWGLGKYRVDIDYFKVDVIKAGEVGPDLGSQLPYHPPLEQVSVFKNHVPAFNQAFINATYPNNNFSNWRSSHPDTTRLLTVGEGQTIILRWDLNDFKKSKISRSGILELALHSVQRSPDFEKDFGMIRITEILGGDHRWNEEHVTWNSFVNGEPISSVLNEQMTIDSKIVAGTDNKAYFTISYPVLQRLIEGKTLGLAIKPLGAIVASFYRTGLEGNPASILHFDTDKQ